MKRKLPGWPMWAAYMTLGRPYRVGDVAHLPIRVVVHRRRAMLWALFSGRVRVSRLL